MLASMVMVAAANPTHPTVMTRTTVASKTGIPPSKSGITLGRL